MAWAFSAENVNNVNNDFTNFFWPKQNITMVFLTFLGCFGQYWSQCPPSLFAAGPCHWPLPLGPISLAWGHKKPGLL